MKSRGRMHRSANAHATRPENGGSAGIPLPRTTADNAALQREDWELADPKGQPPEQGRAIRDEVRERVLRLIVMRGWRRTDAAEASGDVSHVPSPRTAWRPDAERKRV